MLRPHETTCPSVALKQLTDHVPAAACRLDLIRHGGQDDAAAADEPRESLCAYCSSQTLSSLWRVACCCTSRLNCCIWRHIAAPVTSHIEGQLRQLLSSSSRRTSEASAPFFLLRMAEQPRAALRHVANTGQ